MSETYAKPAHGWTCFHCGETFTTVGGARDHFGFDPSSDPGCRVKLGAERGLLMALRRVEEDAAAAWSALQNETGDIAKAYHAAVARHREQLVTAEEAGFERGVRQAKSELVSELSAAAHARGIAEGRALEAAPTEDHETIWLDCLHNDQGDQGRMWAKDNPFNKCEKPGCAGPVEFIRMDLHTAAIATLKRGLAAEHQALALTQAEKDRFLGALKEIINQDRIPECKYKDGPSAAIARRVLSPKDWGA